MNRWCSECTIIEGSHHINWNSIIYRKVAIHMTEIERPFLAVKGFNANLLQCLPPYYVISNVHVCFFMCTISHVHRHAPKTVLYAQNLVYEKILIYEGLLWFLFLRPQTTVQLYILRYYSSVRIGFDMNNTAYGIHHVSLNALSFNHYIATVLLRVKQSV